ncbi:GNAT family N-acetyltransferase [Nonomuraea sp. NPDC049309]|uniref:GNAT family N-acetyltransferase n=1 Tax=Nonomuraea sp. NPDC049309 TaxID=3364350 RepID=UPI00371EC579
MRNWPLFELKITTPNLSLHVPSLEELDELADRAADGVHEEGQMPFIFPWTEGTPAERAQRTIQYHFSTWGRFSADEWAIEFVVVRDGQVLGVQGVTASDFRVLKEVKTGSWLGRPFQGQGVGTEMRQAVLHFAFAGLGARYALTEAFDDNPASLRVTRKLGYHDDGFSLIKRGGEPVVSHRFRLPREDWKEQPGFEIHGLDACLPLFGLDKD